MHVRVRDFGKADVIVVVESKLTKIEQFRRVIRDKLGVEIDRQRLFYGGKLLEDGYTLHDYNIKLNDVVLLMPKVLLSNDENIKTSPKSAKKETAKKAEKNIVYTDAICKYYAVGDLIDMRERELGVWLEGKIVKIVHDPCAPKTDADDKANDDSDENIDSENKAPLNTSNTPSPPKSKPRGIEKYFTKPAPTSSKKKMDKDVNKTASISEKCEENLLYKIEVDNDTDSNIYCKFKEIRPRAYRVIDVDELKPRTTVMINHNLDDPMQKGYWYDFLFEEITMSRSRDLVGTLFLGPDAIPKGNTRVKILDKIFAIEEPVPLDQRTPEFKQIMATYDEKRSLPLNCSRCRDDEDMLCKWCGCYLCFSKDHPEKIILCDECNLGYHMDCLKPPLTEVPEDDWYCPTCKLDPNEVVAPGAAKQTKKSASKSKRDWGRGMACVGKTKSCAMPRHHFGPIPGVQVGMCWKFRIQMSELGIHRPPVSGIHGCDDDGAYSLVLSGGYEDDVDNGYEFTYTGSGGRDLSGNKRTAQQSCDQVLTRENRALARNCATPRICQEGATAGDNWREGKPVRVVRSYKMLKHGSKYAPQEGVRYDGIYKVVKYYPERGLSGFIVWKYLLRRDDPEPAPWEEGAKKFSVVYPDGYLEAEAEKRASKQKNTATTKKMAAKPSKKRALHAGNSSPNLFDSCPPAKKRKADEQSTDDIKEADISPQTKKSSPSTPSEKAKESKTLPPPDKSKATTSSSSDASHSAAETTPPPQRRKSARISPTSEKAKTRKDTTTTSPATDNKDAKTSPLSQSGKPTQMSPPSKEGNATGKGKEKSNQGKLSFEKIPLIKIVDIFKSAKVSTDNQKTEECLSLAEREAIEADTLNEKLWNGCVAISKNKGKKEFVDQVTESFNCIICQDVAAHPVTTPCLHNFCMGCLKLAFKSTDNRSCPCCRHSLVGYKVAYNEELRTALRTILPGYDIGKK